MKKIIAITGLNGVLGKNLLLGTLKNVQKKYKFIDLYHSKKNISADSLLDVSHIKIDLTVANNITEVLNKVKPDYIIHLAAITHIDRCEKDKINGKNGQVWQVNVNATSEIAKFCQQNHARLIFLSTECVFNGQNEISYSEESLTKPKNWYGFTKAAAETVIRDSKSPWTIIRSVVAYDINDDLPTIFSSIKKAFELGSLFNVVNDQKFTPTYIPDIYFVIWRIILKNHNGIFHVVPKIITTPYQFAITIGKHFAYDTSIVKGLSMRKYFSLDQSKLRLKNACLDSTASVKILKYKPKMIEKVLKNLK